MENNQDDDKSKIRDFEEKLNSKKEYHKKGRSQLHPKNYDIPEDFTSSDEEKEVSDTEGKKKKLFSLKKPRKKKAYLGSSPFRKLFLASLLFFVMAGGVAAAMVYSNTNTISAKKVDINVIGPHSAKAGDSSLFQISVTNNNKVPLESSNLRVTFPKGTRDPKDLTKDLTTFQKQIGSIAPGQTQQVRVEAALFGNENDKKNIEIVFQYKIQKSDAIFVKKTNQQLEITSSPVVMNVNILRASPSDQNIKLTVTLNSNSNKVINNLVLQAEYPQGFTFLNSSVKASSSNSLWKLGDISPGEKKVITINGKITGSATEKKIFRFTAGISAGKVYGIGVPYAKNEVDTTIEAPFVTSDIVINNQKNQQNQVLVPDKNNNTSVSGVLSWKNNTGTRLTDLGMDLVLDGSVIDSSSVSGGDGFYNSANNTILWNNRTKDTFSNISKNETGNLSFHFSFFNPFTPGVAAIRNPEVAMNLSIHGNRISESGVSQALKAYVTRTLKIQTLVELSDSALHFSSPFTNTGPMPPTVGQKTTYTISWVLKNSFNDVTGAEVSAKLPAYIQWEGKFIPKKENLHFNATTGVVTWDVGNLSAGAGTQNAAREVDFQVSLTPSLSQVGSSVNLISAPTFTGNDTFTGTSVSADAVALDTNLSNEAGFNGSMAQVVR
jgi:hypothetical protein